MRITNTMLVNDLLWNANNNLESLSELQNQIATGYKVNKPSDDPVAVTQILKYKSDISAAEQYSENITTAQGWLEVSESSVDDVKEILQRIRELTVQAANGSNTEEDTQQIQTEVEQLKDELISLGNSTIAGRYIFSGLETDEPLFNEDGTYNIDMTTERVENQDVVSFEVYTAEVMDVATHPIDIFGITDDSSFFDDVIPPGNATTTAATASTLTASVDLTNDYTTESLRFNIGGDTYVVDTSGMTPPLTEAQVVSAISSATNSDDDLLSEVANVYYNASSELVIEALDYGSDTTIVDNSSSAGFTVLTNVDGIDATDSVYTSDVTLSDADVEAFTGKSTLSVTVNGEQVSLEIDFYDLDTVEDLVDAIQTELDEAFPPDGTVVAGGTDGDFLTLTMTGAEDGTINTMDVYYEKTNFFNGLLTAGSTTTTEATRSIANFDIDLTNDFEAAGEAISIDVGGTTYTVDMTALSQTPIDPLTKSDVLSAVKEASDGSGGTLSDVANIYYDTDGQLVIEAKAYGSTTTITDSSTSAGFTLDTNVAGTDAVDSVYTSDDILQDVDVANYSGTSTLVVTVNGEQVNLEIDFSTLTTADDFVAEVQSQLDEAFPPAGTVVAGGTDGANFTLTMTGATDGSTNTLDVDYVTSNESQMFDMLDDLIEALEVMDQDTIELTLAKLDDSIDTVLTAMGDIGGKTNRVEFISERIDENIITYTELLSNVQDVDMAEAIMYFTNLENVYNASLSVGAQVIQPSLVDFLS